MATSTAALHLSLAVAFAAVICSVAGAGAALADVAAVCKKADHADLCYSAAKQIYKSHMITPKGATKASILVTLQSTKQAKTMANLLKSKGKGNASMEKANFNVCQQLYDDAIKNLQTSLKNLHERAHSDLMINLSAVLTDYSTCDDAFTEEPGLETPLAKINNQLNMLTKNNLALAQALH